MKASLEIDNQKAASNKPGYRPMWLVALECLLLPCVAIVALEGFFKFAQVGEQEFLQPNEALGNVHIPNKVVTWRLEGYSHDRLSPQGLRDIGHEVAKPPGVTRIALLGDSATEGMQVPLERTYGRALDRQLNREAFLNKTGKHFEVINFGCSGYSTGQQVLQYEQQVRQYKPDVVILMYNRGDNIENVFVPAPAGSIPPRPYFKLDDKGSIKTDFSVMEMNKDKLHPDPMLAFLRSNSRIFGVFSQQNLMLSINEPLYRKLNLLYSKLQFSHSAVAANRFVKPTYPLQDPWVVTTKLLDRLRSDVDADGGHFALLMFPNAIKDKDYSIQIKAFEQDSRAKGFDLISLDPVFNKMPDPKLLFLQYHFSELGHSVVSLVVHNYLVAHGYLGNQPVK